MLLASDSVRSTRKKNKKKKKKDEEDEEEKKIARKSPENKSPKRNEKRNH
jgi:hypothetical protein